MIRKRLQIDENRKLLQHKFRILSLICRMMATDALQALRHGLKSPTSQKPFLVGQRREL